LMDYIHNPATFGTLNIYKIQSDGSRLPGDLNIGKLISRAGNLEGWQNWNIVLDIANNSHGAIRCPAGNILFGLNCDGNFYWASYDWSLYTMVLDHWGNLSLSGSLWSYDEYDDLAIVKAIKTKSITENGKTKQIIDLNSLNLVRPTIAMKEPIQSNIAMTEHYDVGKVQGFTLCCLKNIALKLDTHETTFSALLDRVEALESQVKANTA
jgi:hypothetical protein